MAGFLILAVREGFEPSNGLTRYTLSKRAPSASRTPHLLTFDNFNEINIS